MTSDSARHPVFIYIFATGTIERVGRLWPLPSRQLALFLRVRMEQRIVISLSCVKTHGDLILRNGQMHTVSASNIADNFLEQPQRPTRTLRVYDENAIPSVGAQKTLHQRNKSSPALSSMHHAGGLKVAAKRTAFGDVSNTANVSRPSKDDSAIGGKGDYSILEKPAQDRKTTTFLRPAQRPLSVSGLKGLLSNVTHTTSQAFVRQPLSDLQQPSQPASTVANTRKVVMKKSTAVSKDPTPVQTEQPVLDLHKPLPSTAPVAPVHRELQPRAQFRQPEELPESGPKLARKQSKYIAPSEPQESAALPSVAPASSEEAPALRSDGIYIDDQGQVRCYEYTDPVEPVDLVQSVDKHVMLTMNTHSQGFQAGLEPILDIHVPKTQPEPALKLTLTHVSEPEEYWDDDGDENYDEEGYVTARSFKSRGENTTGAATTILFPKISQKAKKEIAAAKDMIEGSKTTEELEDEAWDTTMVAEYGEEIFQYMKDLEVKSVRSKILYLC